MAQQHINYSQPNDGQGDSLRTSQVKSESNFNELYALKVDKIEGQGLSERNFTQIEKTKLANLVVGGQFQSNFKEGDILSKAYILNKPENVTDFFNDAQYIADVQAVGIFARSAGQWVDLAQPIPFGLFKAIQKGFGNILTTPQAGDIYCGWRNDGLVRYSEALYISGSLDNSDNFKPLVQTEI